MKLEKAIELLNLYEHDADSIPGDDFLDALKLGIEALKLLSQEPPQGYTCIPRPLPGETEE